MYYVIDARNLDCPEPVLKTKEGLEKAGDRELMVMVTSETSRDNVMRFLEHSGAEIDKVIDEKGFFSIYAKNTQSAVIDTENDEELKGILPEFNERGTAFFITKDRIGEGSEELGMTLLKAFIASIKELRVQPRVLCFMNSGIKLVVEGSQSLENLRELEKRGIQMLACGTCLNYYGLQDKLGAGKVSNMYDIMETLLKSSKVITI